MARITVEDCLNEVRNRFELVLLAAKRARQLELGASDPTVGWENDKPTVVALREIANGTDSFKAQPRDVVVDLINEQEFEIPVVDQESKLDEQ